ncbi:MAG: HAD family hydrolase [Ilumatobacteraceae bacterium]
MDSVWSQVTAVLFDLDGVITPTADIHQRAWLQALSDFDADETDYHNYIDGRPRLDGVRGFLRGRSLTLPEGNPSDAASTSSVYGIAALKNSIFLHILEHEPFSGYPGSLAVLSDLEQRLTPFALVTSSKNAEPVLRASGLRERFSIIVDGIRAEEESLRGKPAPDTYLRAASLLGVAPIDCAVVEDAVSGVMAGHAGGFGTVIGVNRGAGRDALIAAGADLVVDDLQETLP